MHNRFFIFTLNVIILVGSFFSATAGSGADIKTIGGQWQLNQKLSDDARAKAAAAAGGGLLAGFRQKRVEAALQQFVSAASELTISVQSSQVTIAGKGQNPRTLRTDGQPQKFTSLRGREVTTTTFWRNDQLVINGVTEEGAKLVQTFARLPGENRISLTIRLEDKHLTAPLLIRYIYDEQEKGR